MINVPSKSFVEEFDVVDLVVQSGLVTGGVDAFALSLIKAERQMRRIFTHLVFQSSAFSAGDVPALREALGASKRSYFEGFSRGIDALFDTTVRTLVGEEHDYLAKQLADAIDARNKIFHGQLTGRCLERADLLQYVADIRTWCGNLSSAAHEEIGYDGFERNSFRKSGRTIAERLRINLSDLDAYKQLIRQYIERPTGGKRWAPPG